MAASGASGTTTRPARAATRSAWWRTRACSIGDAIVWSRAWSGGEANYTESPRGRMPSKDDAADIAAHARQIEDAQGLWRGSTPAHATLAATYLGVR